MSRRAKIFVGVGIVVVLGAAGAISVRGNGRGATEVRVATVERRDLVATVTANGNIRARRMVDISADVVGRIVELNVDEGEDVEQGQVLLRIDPTQFAAALSRAQAALSQARAQEAQQRANFVRAEREDTRMADMWARDSTLVRRQQVEDAATEKEVAFSLLEAARFGVQQAEAAVDESRDQLNKTTIRAPMSGKVTRLNVEQGETVVMGTMNNAGSLILTISDLSVIEAVMEVDETDVPEISVGDSAVVRLDAFPDREFVGRVTEIGNSAIRPPGQAGSTGQTQTIDFEVVITLENPTLELRPDLSASADVIVESRSDVLSVPIIGLTVRDRSDLESGDTVASEDDVADTVEGVFVVTDGLAHFRPVTVGIAGEDYFEIEAGLDGGETIVAGPYQAVRNLRDGDRVEVAEDDDDASGSRRSGAN